MWAFSKSSPLLVCYGKRVNPVCSYLILSHLDFYFECLLILPVDACGLYWIKHTESQVYFSSKCIERVSLISCCCVTRFTALGTDSGLVQPWEPPHLTPLPLLTTQNHGLACSQANPSSSACWACNRSTNEITSE